jgi:hypothetical protein
MVEKSKLSKDIEEQIQSLASDVYIQVEDKLTNLIAAAVKAELSKNTDQQNKVLSEKEQSLEKNFSEKQSLQVQQVEKLKQLLMDKQSDAETARQNFQVELTQNTINYTETIELLEKEVANLKQQSTLKNDEKQSNNNKLDEKLLETEQKLNDRNQEVDGLNGRIMVLTEQEQSLTKQLGEAKSQLLASDTQKDIAVATAKAQVEYSSKEKIEALTAKTQQLETESKNVRVEAEALQSSDNKVKVLQQKVSQLAEQAQQEQNGKAELQQQLSVQQKSIDTEQDKNRQAEQKSQDYQAQIIKLTEQAAIDKQQLIDEIKSMNEDVEKTKQLHLDEIKAINDVDGQAKQLQTAAQQNIIELEKANEQLSKQVETEQNDIKLYKQEVVVLSEQVKVAQEGQENILQRFNSNRDKQEIENNKVRETIKFLRDENHQLISDHGEQKAQFNDQTNELEHKLTEYRLKFEYAQKQLTN